MLSLPPEAEHNSLIARIFLLFSVAMMMKSIFLQAQHDDFWGLTESQMHTLCLRAGVIIPKDKWDDVISVAKANFFVAPNQKGPTNEAVVNIAIALWRNKPIDNCFNS